jgi:hypothetical protein
LSGEDDPIPNPNPNGEADGEEQVGHRLIAALERLANNGLGGGAERQGSRAKLWEPDPFDGKGPKKLRGFLLQCTLNFRARPQDFRHDSMKVNYALSFLKEPALDYFKPYLVDDAADELLWVSDYTAFTEELYLYFGPYNQVADAEVELENLVMKDNHKATRFFIEFYRLSSMLQYNDSALHRRAYLALPKRIKDKMVHFDKPRSLNNLQDLVQKIDQRYWERCGELTREPHSAPKTEAKQDKSSNQNRGSQNNDRRRGQGSGNSNANTSSGKGKEKLKGNQGSDGNKKPETDRLGKDGKLTPEERQWRMDNQLCLVCAQSGHRARECPKAKSARAAKASEEKTSESKAETSASGTKK